MNNQPSYDFDAPKEYNLIMPPSNRSLFLIIRAENKITILVCFAVLLCFIGCEESQHSLPSTNIPLENPEEDLRYAMERLDKVIGSSRAKDSLGLKITRSMNYEYLPVADDRKKPTALVTIKTISTFVQEQKKKPKPKKKKKERSDLGVDPELVDPYMEEEDKEFFDLRLKQEAFNSIEKPELEADVKSPRKEEINTYDLIYQQGKWKIKSEPDSEYEKLWFDYALN